MFLPTSTIHVYNITCIIPFQPLTGSHSNTSRLRQDERPRHSLVTAYDSEEVCHYISRGTRLKARNEKNKQNHKFHR